MYSYNKGKHVRGDNVLPATKENNQLSVTSTFGGPTAELTGLACTVVLPKLRETGRAKDDTKPRDAHARSDARHG